MACQEEATGDRADPLFLLHTLESPYWSPKRKLSGSKLGQGRILPSKASKISHHS